MPYAVIQDGYAIFGVGSTTDKAVADARQWVSDPDTLDDLPDRPQFIGDMYVTDCTEALAAAVKQHGGEIEFVTRQDGTACLPDEDDH